MPNEREQRISLIRNETQSSPPLTPPRFAKRGTKAGKSLLRWRAWFADEDREGQGEQGDGDDGSPKTLEDANRLIAALRKRVEDKAREKDEAVREANTRAAAAEAERKKKLAEEGNFKTLAEQAQAEAESLRGYKDRVGALEQVIRDSNEGRIKSLPESVRELVPVDYAPEKLQAWLNKNESLLKKPAPPNFDGGAGAGGSGSGGKQTVELPADEAAEIKKFGISPEDYLKAKKATGQI